MAQTDPNDSTPVGQRWTFLEKLQRWFSGGPGGLIKNSGGTQAVSGVDKAIPKEARAARIQMTAQFITRMEEAKNKNKVWENDLEELLQARLKSMFHPDNYNRMKLDKSTWTNPMRRVVCDISRLYENPARRYIAKTPEELAAQAEQTAAVESVRAKAEQDAKRAKLTALADGKEPPPAGDKPPAKKAAPPKKDPKAEVKKVDPKAPSKPAVAEEDEDEGDDEGASEDAPPVPGADPNAQGVGADMIGTGDPEVDGLLHLLDVETGDDGADSPLRKLLDALDIDVVMDLVEKKARIHECVWVRPRVIYDEEVDEVTTSVDDEGKETTTTERMGDTSTGRMVLEVFDPSCADVVPDPDCPSEALAWYYHGQQMGEDGKLHPILHFYTKEEYFKFTQDWRILDWEPLPEPLVGHLPVIPFRAELPSQNSYYCHGVGRDLYAATLEFNGLRTIQNARYRDSGFKQLALTSVDPDDVPADQVMGGPSPIYIPEGGAASVLDMESGLQVMTEMVTNRATELAATYGITAASYKAEGAPQSGFAKKLDEDKILKENRRIRKFFHKAEKALFKLIILTLKAYPVDGLGEGIDPDADYQVDYAEPTFEEAPADQAVTDARNIKLNFISIIDILSRENPDLSEVELLRLAYRNRRINEVFIPKSAMSLLDVMAHNVGVASGGGGGPPVAGGGMPGQGDDGGGEPPAEP